MTTSRFTITPMLLMALLGAPLPFCLMVWFAIVSPELMKTYADFGGVLPWVTILVIQPGWSVAMILAYVFALPATFLFRTPLHRDFAIVSVVLAGLLAAMASTACLYLPLFQMSQALN